MNAKQKSCGHTGHSFGTFGGVFTPSILTILGVIMFLRAGFVVGQAGIKGALLILILAELISLLTALSLSGISTNTPVQGGGAYFLISRIMGPGFGGSIGLALFFAQALSIPFYIIGFTEALVQAVPNLREYFTYIAVCTSFVLFAINYISAGWAIKTQYIVMTVLGVSIVAMFGGAAVLFNSEQFLSNWNAEYSPGHYNFWSIFAIYFPAVTGIMTGVNMSGDLKDPARSIVRGTLAAIGVGGLIYLIEILLCGGAYDRMALVNDPFVTLIRSALFGTGFLVIAGVFAATLSSALGSFMGAPRIMQALARDRILFFLRPLAKGTKEADEPRRALILTLILTLIVLWLASGQTGGEAFNIVAAIVAMFFLCTYGMINLAAFVESFSSNPSFRPRFHYFHWSTSLLGAIGCACAMLLIDWAAAILSVIVVVLLYIFISRRAYRTDYGDARRGFVYSLVTRNLGRLRGINPHSKNWRPTFLVLSGNPGTRLNLVRYATWLEAGHGIVTMAEILIGKLDELAERRLTALDRAQKFIKENNLTAYPEVLIAEDFDEGIRSLIQAHSIGPIKPNTILLGWPSDPTRVHAFVRHLRDIKLLNKSLLLVIDKENTNIQKNRYLIDIWWRGKENGSLMLILAHLLTRNWQWNRARIRVLRIVDDEAGREPATAALKQLVVAGRMQAEIVIIISTAETSEVIKEYSKNSDVVFMGFTQQQLDKAEQFEAHFSNISEKLPSMILVSTNGEADLLA